MAYTKLNHVSPDQYGYASTINKIIDNFTAIVGADNLSTSLKSLLDNLNALKTKVDTLDAEVRVELETAIKNVSNILEEIKKENNNFKTEWTNTIHGMDSRLYKLIDSTGYKSTLNEYFNDDTVKPINRYRVIIEDKYYDFKNNNWVDYTFPNKKDFYSVLNPPNNYELIDNDIPNPTFDKKYKWAIRVDIQTVDNKEALDDIEGSTTVYQTIDNSKYYRFIDNAWTEIVKHEIATKDELDNSIVVSGEVLKKEDLPDAIGYKRRNLALSINKLLDDLGFVADLTTVHKTTAVGAVNELDKEIGDLATLGDVNNMKQTTIVATLNKINELIGDLSTIFSTNTNLRGASVVEDINKLDAMLGLFTDVNAQIKGSTYTETFNNINTILGNFSSINTQIKQADLATTLNKVNELLGTVADVIDPEITATNLVDIINNLKLKMMDESINGLLNYILIKVEDTYLSQGLADMSSILENVNVGDIIDNLSTVNNIGVAVDMSSPAVSHHLRLLKQAGLIEARRDGKEMYYRLADAPKAQLLHKSIDDIFDISCPAHSIK